MQRTMNREENVFEEMKEQCDWRCSEQGKEGNEVKVKK